jgi:integrase
MPSGGWSRSTLPRLRLENLTPHSFRHTVATRLVYNPQVDLVTAATFLGHSRLDTTARYAQPSEVDLARAAEVL